MKNFSNMLNKESIRSLIKDVITNKVYNDIDVPIPLENNYFMNNNYGLLLIMDALIKYDIIIEDTKYLNEFVEDLRLIIKKMKAWEDIKLGVNTLLAKYSGKILEIEKDKKDSKESKEKILRYIYQRYIVEGYFYYGFSSCHKNEIESLGIKKEGFALDPRLIKINNVLRKYEGKNVIMRKNANITDNFVVASYFSFIGPDFLDKLATSKIFGRSGYNNNFYYTKNMLEFKDNIIKYSSDRHFNGEENNTIIDLLNVWKDYNISNQHGCIAFIKREKLNRNSLKDFEEIVKCLDEQELVETIGMVMESRYTSYSLDEDIDNNLIEIIDIPSYNDIISNEKIYVDVDEEEIKEIRILKNSYGFANIVMFAGLILLSLGVVVAFVVSVLGW